MWARGVVSDPKIVSRLAETELLARETMDAIRQSIFELSCLDEVPRHRLVAGLRQIVSEYRAEGLAMSLCVAGTPRDAPAEIERELALLAHEGLGNVHSHTRAARAVIRLTFGRATMRLSNLDDGMGVPTALGPCIGPARRRRDGNQCGLAFLESAVAAMGVRMSVSEARMGGVRLSSRGAHHGMAVSSTGGTDPVRVVVVDDHPLIRQGLRVAHLPTIGQLVARFRPRVRGHNTTACVSCGAAGRRRGGRSLRSGLGRAGSASRPSKRPSRRTGTATARPSLLHVPGTVDIRSTTVRCRCWRPHACTGVDHLRSALGGDSLLASRSSSGRIRSHVVPSRKLPADHLGKRPICALVITRVDERHHRVDGATPRASCTTRQTGGGGVPPRQY